MTLTMNAPTADDIRARFAETLKSHPLPAGGCRMAWWVEHVDFVDFDDYTMTGELFDPLPECPASCECDD